MELLHSKILGQGKPLLILHGFLGMLDNWKTLGNEFASRGFQVHLIDQRNHGKSFHSELFNYELLANDIKHYINHHNLSRVSIIGHSMGGKTAMFFAIAYPELINRILIADIAPKYYPPHHDYILEGLSAIDFNRLKSRKEADEILSGYVTDAGTRQFLLKNLYRISKDQFAFRFNLQALIKNVENIGQALPPDAVYPGDVLFLRGSRSDYIKDEEIPSLKQHFPNAKIDTIDHAGHWLHADNPMDFFSKAFAFLSSD